MAITRRQRQVLDFITDFIRENGYSPSFEEIGHGLGLSSLATVHKHVHNLKQKNYLNHEFNRSRSIDVVPNKSRAKVPGALIGLQLPLEGRIVAGQPLEHVPNPETISLSDFTRSKDVFLLEVTGESMKDDHIVEGDYVLVEKTPVANNGEIVVALVDNTETTLKRFYKEGETVRLQPANSTMQPIMVPAANVAIQGRVIGVLRKY